MADLLRALRKEIKSAARDESLATLRRVRSELKSIRKSLAALETRIDQRGASLARRDAKAATVMGSPAEEGRRARFSPALMRKHRESLGMSRKAYARLLGVSSLSVYFWEAARTRPRRATIFAWQDLRKKGARELRALAGVVAPKRAKAAKAVKAAKAATSAKKRGVATKRVAALGRKVRRVRRVRRRRRARAA